MIEQEEIDYQLEIARVRDYPSLTLDEMRDIFNETYKRLAEEDSRGWGPLDKKYSSDARLR
jgi:hypothetical protein